MKRKTRRILSLLLALSVMATMLVALPLAGYANEVSASVGTIYKAEDLFANCSNTELSILSSNDAQKAYYEGLGSPFGDIDSIATTYTKRGADKNVDATLTYNIDTDSTYVFSILVAQYGGRHPSVSVDGEEKVDGATIDVSSGMFIGNNGSGRNYAVMQVEVDLAAGEHTFALSCSTSGRVQGVHAVILTDKYKPMLTLTPNTLELTPGTSATIVPAFANFAEGTSKTDIKWTIEGSDGINVASDELGNGVVTVDKSVVDQATAKVTAALNNTTATCDIIVHVPTWTGVVKSSDMTISNGNHAPVGCSVTLNEEYIKEYSDIFGENLENAGTNRVGYIKGDGTYVSTEYTLVEDGAYRIYVLTESQASVNQITLTKDNEQVLTPTVLSNSASIGTSDRNNKVTIYTYDINLEAGIYNFVYDSSTKTGYTSDIIAMAIAPVSLVEWTANGTDSGVYIGTDGDTYGVIRFLQAFTAENVTGYGFYIVNGADASFEDASYTIRKSNTETTTVEGIYADLYEIASANINNTFYMIPFVEVNNTPVVGTFISGNVNTENEVIYPEN